MEPSFELELGTRLLEQLPNYRAVSFGSSSGHQAMLYRSGHIDRLSEAGLRDLAQRVTCVIDLRGRRELLRTLPRSHVTRVYRQRVLATDGSVSALAEAPDAAGTTQDRTRFTIDFLGRDFFIGEFRQLPARSMLTIGTAWAASFVTGDRSYEGQAAEIILKPRGLVGQACDFVDFCQREVAAVLRQMLQPGCLPCLLHCFLGKDRTGLVVLLLQWLLNVPVQLMRTEYLLSQNMPDDVKQEAVRYYADKRLPATFAECHGEEFDAVVQRIESKYGGVRAYLMGAGLTQHELQLLQQKLSGSAEVEN